MKKAIIFGMLMIFLSSCATIFTRVRASVYITSVNPPTAKVYRNGTLVGTGPCSVKMYGWSVANSKIVIKENGYEDQTFLLKSKVKPGALIFDIIFLGLPIVVDLATGALIKASPNEIRCNLRSKNYNNGNNNGNNNNNNNPPPISKKALIDYSGYPESDLAIALKAANIESDLDAMLVIQKEIDKRKQLDEFSKYTYVQLHDQLNKALDKEDYKQAALIKKEIAKRDAQK